MSVAGRSRGSTTNVEGLTYATQQNSYLDRLPRGARRCQGAASKNISVVGGVKIPPVDTFLAGYKAGAQKCVPGTTVHDRLLAGLHRPGEVQERRPEPDRRRLAGRVRASPVRAASVLSTRRRRAGRWGVGVDVDQSYLGNHILTSAVKRVDPGIFLAVKGAKSGKGFKGGGNLVFNLKNGGVALGKISKKAKIQKAWIVQINTLKTQIIAGKIKPPTTVGGS